MYTELTNFTEVTCDCCGGTVQAGDLVYDSGQIFIHAECFFDYIRMFVLETDGVTTYMVMKKWIKKNKRMIRGDEHENKRGICSVLIKELQNNQRRTNQV